MRFSGYAGNGLIRSRPVAGLSQALHCVYSCWSFSYWATAARSGEQHTWDTWATALIKAGIVYREMRRVQSLTEIAPHGRQQSAAGSCNPKSSRRMTVGRLAVTSVPFLDCITTGAGALRQRKGGAGSRLKKAAAFVGAVRGSKDRRRGGLVGGAWTTRPMIICPVLRAWDLPTHTVWLEGWKSV